MLTLPAKQLIFSKLIAKLIYLTPVDCSLGEAWRSEETCALYAKEGKGIKNSCHQLRLAIDLNVWVDGKLSNKKDDYQLLGDTWKTFSEDDFQCYWGGDFHSLADFYHFSIGHNGVR